MTESLKGPTTRFDDRVLDYERGRPGYPIPLVDAVRDITGCASHATIADIGAGTGILSEMFVGRGHPVVAVEPSRAMADAARSRLSEAPGFRVVSGTAEATGLASASIEVAVAAQAFHWFDPSVTRLEWERILTEPRGVALIWNRRRLHGTPFLEAYENFVLEWSVDYANVAARYESPEGIERVLGYLPSPLTLKNLQRLDRRGLEARLQSSSYLPAKTHVRHPKMLKAAHDLFDAHQREGYVELVYDTVIYGGRLSST